MADRAVGPYRLSLGIKLLNRHLELTVDNYKVKFLLKLLNTEWRAGRKNFMVLTEAVFIGNVYTATPTYTWLR